MKSTLVRLAAAAALLGTSAIALAASPCCGDLLCCLEQLACCFQ